MSAASSGFVTPSPLTSPPPGQGNSAIIPALSCKINAASSGSTLRSQLVSPTRVRGLGVRVLAGRGVFVGVGVAVGGAVGVKVGVGVDVGTGVNVGTGVFVGPMVAVGVGVVVTVGVAVATEPVVGVGVAVAVAVAPPAAQPTDVAAASASSLPWPNTLSGPDAPRSTAVFSRASWS